MALSPTRARARARLASACATRNRRPDDLEAVAQVDDASRDYWAETLAEYVAAVVAKAPPLTDTQRTRLAALLHKGGA
jgi:hypothetical protein